MTARRLAVAVVLVLGARCAPGIGVARTAEVLESLLPRDAVRHMVPPDSVAVPEAEALPGLAAVVRVNEPHGGATHGLAHASVRSPLPGAESDHAAGVNTA